MNGPTVVVGMSGGVDSSVSAYLLKKQGYNVVGMFMKNWEETSADGFCPSAIDYDDVVAVCDQLQIPCYAVNFSQNYWDQVFEHFLEELKAGRTPNPDILCNREIKFKVLLEKAKELGAEFLATGHYCRIGHTESQEAQLLRGIDAGKDQSYFLYALHSTILSEVLFPIGNLPKKEVRAIAQDLQLATAKKKDSTGICFIGKRPFKEFVSQYIAYHPGKMITPEGKVVGQHDGVAYYTIGQRHGMGIGGPGEPWFVADKRIDSNELVVVQGGEHPALFKSTLQAHDLTWISLNGPPSLPCRCTAKIRYRQADQACTLTIEQGTAHVAFDEPQRAVTPGQSVVFYQGDVCLGGGIIGNQGGTPLASS